MNYTNRTVMVLAGLAISVAVCQVQAQNSLFSENFDGAGFSNGPLNGQGGWTADTQLALASGTLGGVVGELGHDGTRGVGAPGTLGNFTATHSLGQTISDGILFATALINPSAGSQNKGGSLFLSDGGSNFLEVEALGGSGGIFTAESEFSAISSGQVPNTLGIPFPEPLISHYVTGAPKNTFDDVAWVQVEIEYNLSAGTAVARLRDVEEFILPRAFRIGTSVHERPFPAFTPFDVTTVGIRSNNAYLTNPGRIDNIEVGFVPEPATAGMLLLGMVALWMVRRRRRAVDLVDSRF